VHRRHFVLTVAVVCCATGLTGFVLLVLWCSTQLIDHPLIWLLIGFELLSTGRDSSEIVKEYISLIQR
jgi:hypothetical protein